MIRARRTTIRASYRILMQKHLPRVVYPRMFGGEKRAVAAPYTSPIGATVSLVRQVVASVNHVHEQTQAMKTDLTALGKQAEKTIGATKAVGATITGMQMAARQSITSMDRASSVVEETTTLSHKSGAVLDAILRLARKTPNRRSHSHSGGRAVVRV